MIEFDWKRRRNAGHRCGEKAKTMPHFIVVASDPACIETIHAWIKCAETNGTAKDKISAARKAIGAVSTWRSHNPELCKVPD